MNNIMNKYLILGFSKVIINAILIFLSLGVVLNLFEEIEFLKNSKFIIGPILNSREFNFLKESLA